MPGEVTKLPKPFIVAFSRQDPLGRVLTKKDGTRPVTGTMRLFALDEAEARQAATFVLDTHCRIDRVEREANAPAPDVAVHPERDQVIHLLVEARRACRAFNSAGLPAPGGLAMAAERLRNSIGITAADLPE